MIYILYYTILYIYIVFVLDILLYFITCETKLEYISTIIFIYIYIIRKI